jgi:hypothetical protein
MALMPFHRTPAGVLVEAVSLNEKRKKEEQGILLLCKAAT